MLAAAGAEVTGSSTSRPRCADGQVRTVVGSVGARGVQVPDGGYQGDYIHDLARTIVQDDSAILELPEDRRWSRSGKPVVTAAAEGRPDKSAHFDVWHRTLAHESGAVDRGIEVARGRPRFEQDGAVWLHHGLRRRQGPEC